jgi:hypothetical protein
MEPVESCAFAKRALPIMANPTQTAISDSKSPVLLRTIFIGVSLSLAFCCFFAQCPIRLDPFSDGRYGSTGVGDCQLNFKNAKKRSDKCLPGVPATGLRAAGSLHTEAAWILEATSLGDYNMETSRDYNDREVAGPARALIEEAARNANLG